MRVSCHRTYELHSRVPHLTLTFTCQGVCLTLKIRSPDRVSGLNVSQVPFSSNVSIERSNSRERFLDFCREPERTAFSFRTVSIGAFDFPYSFLFFLFFFVRFYYCSLADSLSQRVDHLSSFASHAALGENLKPISSFAAIKSPQNFRLPHPSSVFEQQA